MSTSGKTTPASTAGSFTAATGPKSRAVPQMDMPDEFVRKVADGTMLRAEGPAGSPVFMAAAPEGNDGESWSFEASRYLGDGEWEWVQVSYSEGQPDKEDAASDDPDRQRPFLSRCVTTVICTDPAHPYDTELDADDEFSDEWGFEAGADKAAAVEELKSLHADPVGSHLWSR